MDAAIVDADIGVDGGVIAFFGVVVVVTTFVAANAVAVVAVVDVDVAVVIVVVVATIVIVKFALDVAAIGIVAIEDYSYCFKDRLIQFLGMNLASSVARRWNSSRMSIM